MTAADCATVPRCAFYLRTQVTDDPTYRYERIEISSPRGDGLLPTPNPPAVGDLILLSDSFRRTGGMFRVIERAWLHAQFGSADWPYTSAHAQNGPTLEVIVEPTEGPFVNVAPSGDEEVTEP